MREDFKDIAAIVPIRNESGHIAGLLGELVRQRGVRHEIIVVDGRSTDDTRAIVEEFQRRHPMVRLCDNPRRLSSAARNTGLLRASARHVVIVDGHCEINDRWFLARHVRLFREHGCEALARPQPLNLSARTRWQEAIAAARSSRIGHNPNSDVYRPSQGFVKPHNVATAYRLDLIAKVGLFDASFDACEDVDFNRRVARSGGRCFIAPGLRVFYTPRRSLKGLFFQLYRYGRGRARLALKRGDRKAAALVGLPLLAASVLAAIGVAAGIDCLIGCVTLLTLLYSGALLLVSLAEALIRRDAALALCLPLVFATIHLAFFTGLAGELLASSTRALGFGNDQCLDG